jgi:uncharacterized protein
MCVIWQVRTDLVTGGSVTSGPRPQAPGARLVRAAMARRWKLGPARNSTAVERDMPVRMRDGVVLLADHFAPAVPGPSPTVLMRCPYGRGLLYSAMAWPYAERGYHVLLQSTRGTFGSGGTFRPYADEAADGQDTVAWLREQDWFDGRLATAGSSYLGFVQWALTLDPPPELRAMVVQIAPHDLGLAASGHGPFELDRRGHWGERGAVVRRVARTPGGVRRLLGCAPGQRGPGTRRRAGAADRRISRSVL